MATSSESHLKEIQKEWHGNWKAYKNGFILSLILTFASFSLVVFHVLGSPYLAYGIVALALLQGAVQVLFFLHLGEEPKPHWESMSFWLMFLILLFVAIGTLWIMGDLNVRGMSAMTEAMPHD